MALPGQPGSVVQLQPLVNERAEFRVHFFAAGLPALDNPILVLSGALLGDFEARGVDARLEAGGTGFRLDIAVGRLKVLGGHSPILNGLTQSHR